MIEQDVLHLGQTAHGNNYRLMIASKALVCIVYVSEGVREPVLQQLRSVINPAALLHSFRDITYNRTSYYLSGPDMLTQALALCQKAFQL
jgi:hypothetical protein